MANLTDVLFEKSVRGHIPLSVHIDLTMRCNELCRHCYRVIEQRPELVFGRRRELEWDLIDCQREGQRPF